MRASCNCAGTGTPCSERRCRRPPFHPNCGLPLRALQCISFFGLPRLEATWRRMRNDCMQSGSSTAGAKRLRTAGSVPLAIPHSHPTRTRHSSKPNIYTTHQTHTHTHTVHTHQARTPPRYKPCKYNKHTDERGWLIPLRCLPLLFCCKRLTYHCAFYFHHSITKSHAAAAAAT